MTDADQSSCLTILGTNKALKTRLTDWLAPHRWSCTLHPDPSEMVSDPDRPSALILIDERTTRPRWRDWVAALRAMDGPVATTPIILLADGTEALEQGLSALAPQPLDRKSMIVLIEDWAGPLDDHAFRDLTNPPYRLLRLGGRAIAEGLITRFAHHLEEALAWLDDPRPGSQVPHQIAGLAGMLGYEAISRSWRAIDRGDSFDSGSARREAEQVISGIRGRFPAGSLQ